ncbi:MAG: cobyrinic acid a,c-diamide synthase [Cyanobacteria bacterium M5B4]|nr:MAG: cobyrinic acid a,c-diamide synthase [Cyanobacteria bacterium M5B4]
MTIIIAGERSGVGKTTITLSILATMVSYGKSIQSFKVGPDYIDAMYHSRITGLPCRNLDPILTSEAYVIDCFNRYANQYSLIEGVMGLFDGLSGVDDSGSTAHIAELLNLPIVLVVNCRSISRSVAAIIHGYNTYNSKIKIKGVILNYLSSERHLEILEQAITPLNIPIIGRFWRDDQLKIPDRYLGLIPTDELDNFADITDRLIAVSKRCLDWNLLLPFLASPPNRIETTVVTAKVKIAVAKDRAFSFYYADNFDLLNRAGIELIFFSPLQDHYLPDGIAGLYFGGGFPELFAAELADNLNLIKQLISLIRSGIPTYAECGGLMYLTKGIVDLNQTYYPMLNIIPTEAVMTNKLTLGYRLGTVEHSSFLCYKKEQIWGHEFHRSVLSNQNPQPLFQLQSYSSRLLSYGEGWSLLNLHASYLHLHFGNKPQIVQRMLDSCCKYQGYTTN